MRMMQAAIHRPATTRHILDIMQAKAIRSSVVISSRGFMHIQGALQGNCNYQLRHFSKKAPGNDPLELLKQSSIKRDYCDEDGYRNKDQHWIFGIATSGSSLESVRRSLCVDLFSQLT